MRFARFLAENVVRYGRIEGEELVELDGPPYGTAARTGRRFPLAGVRLLAPTLPGKVVCLGLNYRDHARELGMALPAEPCLFMKPSTAVIGPGEAIRRPAMSQQVDYEAELAVVIGRVTRDVAPAEVRGCVLGYTCLNDVTARDLQRKDGQWTRAKGFDTFCPIGPWITDEIDPDGAEIELRLNGQLRQKSNTSEFVFKTAEAVSFISRIMTLHPGDVIATGTPFGVGPVQAGDVVEVRIEGIGVLSNPVE
jgi:2-keto-4-pentenoate hydratase/2-oxohepta-3-ene-1,7-dioic acid hydratase in catechol pathway